MGNGGGRVHGPGHGLANNNSSERDDGPRTSGRARLVHMLRSTELPSAFRHSAVVYSQLRCSLSLCLRQYSVPAVVFQGSTG
jgi:hypothetical protein